MPPSTTTTGEAVVPSADAQAAPGEEESATAPDPDPAVGAEDDADASVDDASGGDASGDGASPPSTAAASGDALAIRFNFKGATWEQVLDFFSRTTGLPVVRETPLPEGTVDYLSPIAYDLPEALTTLNILLQTQGVMLRIDSDKLYLQKLEDMKRENIPTYVGALPEEVTDDQIVTVVLPLLNAEATTVAESVAELVAAYGSVTPLPKQNALVIVETAAQVRRLTRILGEIDREDVENIVEFIPIRYAKASVLVESLKSLLGERVVEYVIVGKKRQKIDEQKLPGLSITADERTNAIIARGTRSKIEQLRAAIKLLDVPGSAATREIRTFPLTRLAPDDAKGRLEKLFTEIPKETRPVLMADPELRAVTIVGDDSAVAEAASLLAELDEGTASATAGERAVAVVPLAHLRPDAAVSALNALLTRRQGGTTTLLPGADDASVVIAGDAADVAAAQAMLDALDRPGRPERQIRLLQLAVDDPAAVLAQARSLYDRQIGDDDRGRELTAELDPRTRSLVLIGEPESVSRFAGLVEQLQSLSSPQLDVRLLELEFADAAEVAAFLTGLARGELARAAAGSAPAPAIEVVAPINGLLVGAAPEQHQVIAELVRTVDVPKDQSTPPLRIMQVRTADAVGLAQTLTANYARRGAEERSARPVTIASDPQTNSLLVAAHPDLLPEIEAIVTELNDASRIDTEGREIRIFPLRVARAVELARTIDEMFPEPPMPRDSRGRPRPDLQKAREVVVRGDAQTNSIIVDAPAIRMPEFEQLVTQLDRQEFTEVADIRSWRIVHADLDSAARTLRELASSGALAAAGNGTPPITVATDAATGTLIVAAPSDAFERIEEVIATIDARKAAPTTALRFFRLEVAKAESVAPMLREILASRLAEELPESAAEMQSLLRVTADRRSNALIVSAPEALMPVAEALIEQLDSTAAAGGGDPVIRVRPLTFADAQDVSRSLGDAIGGMISPTTGDPMEVRLTPSPGSNAIIMVGLAGDLDEVEAMVAPLDARPTLDAVDAKTFELVNAEASRIAPIVERLLTDQQETDPRIVIERLRRSRGQIDTTPRIRVEADDRTNSLIVSGPQQTVALAETVISQLDRPEVDEARTFTTFTPANADAAVLAETVARVLDATRTGARRSTLEILPEAQTGSLVLIGTPEETAEARNLLVEWDERAQSAPALELRLVTLDHSQAEMVAPAVTSLLRDRARWPAPLRQRARSGLSVAEPTATAEPSGNRLLLSAPGELMPIAEAVIAELDRPRNLGESIELRVFTLGQARATDVAGALRGALEARALTRPGESMPSVTAEPSSNAVVVAATPEQLRAVEAIIEPLDSAATPDQQQVRTIFLRHARAEQVAPLIESLLARQDLLDPNDLPTWARVDYLRYRQEGESIDVRVVADSRMNAVVVAAPPAILNAAEQMVAQLDVTESPDVADERSVRVLTLENADASDLATSLEEVFREREAEELPPSIRVNPGSNSLIVRATPDQYQVIERVAETIDDATLITSRQMRTVPIDPSRASAEEVAEMLRRLLGRGDRSSVEVISVEELLERSSGAGDAGGPRSMAPADEPAPRPRLITAVPTTSERSSGPSQTEWSAGSSAGSTWVGARMMPHGPLVVPSSLAHRAALGPGLVGAYGAGLESAPATVAIGDETIDSLVTEKVAGVEDAADVEDEGAAISVAMVRSALAALTTPGAVQAPSEPAPQVTDDATDTSADTASPEVTIAVDPRTNSLIVIGSPRTVERVVSLATQAQDQIPARPTPIRVLTLPEGADPSRLSSLVQQTLRRITPAGGRPGQLAGRVGIVADTETNALVVAADDRDFEVVADLVTALSRPGTADRMAVKVYALANLRADRTARSLQTMLGQTGRRTAPLRDLAITLLAPDQDIDAVFDPSQVRIASDEQGNALIVMAPPEAIGFFDRLVEAVDRTPPDATVLKLFPLRFADATEVRRSVREIFRARAGNRSGQPRPEFTVDARTNTLLVSAAPEQLLELESLLAELDREDQAEVQPLRIVPLRVADADDVARIVDRVVIGADQQRRTSSMVIPDAESSVLLVRATPEVNAEIDRVVAELDRPGTRNYPVRTIVLERADAGAVASAIQRFYDDRARLASGGSGRRSANRDVAVVGDPASATLLVAASDEDFEQVQAIVDRFDSQEATDTVDFRLFPLRHARAGDLEETVQSLVSDLTWSDSFFFFGPRMNQQRGREDKVAVRADPRLNALVVTGTGETFELVERLVEVLDAPEADGARVVRLYRVRNADLNVAADLLRDALGESSRNRRWWQPPDPTAPSVRVDGRTRTIIVAASDDQQAAAASILAAIDVTRDGDDVRTEVLPVEFADAADISRALLRFLNERAAIEGAGNPDVAIVPSDATNALMVSAADAEMATIRDLLSRLDQPATAGDRTIEIVPLRDGEATEVTSLVAQQFPRRQGGQGVLVTPDSRTNSIIVNAPKQQFAQIRALIERLDTPPDSAVTVIRTYTLTGTQADEAVRILGDALQLDASGRAEGITILPDGDDATPVEVNARIVSDRRSNSLVVTATEESLPIIEELISKLDAVPASSLVDVRIIKLDHAIASDVSFTLRQLVRGADGEPDPRIDYNRVENQLIIGATADQFEQIDRIIGDLDQPSDNQRITDFVPLRFADAEKLQEALSYFYGPLAIDADTPGSLSVRIVADPATNSLVISADESEWAGIRSLLAKLDSEEYDASLQLRVMPLVYADAGSVAEAINDAFQGRVRRERQLSQGQRGARERRPDGDGERRGEANAPAVLLQADEWVSAAAEELTNSVIVYASRPNIERIERIVTQLDQPGFGQLPPPRLIPVTSGDPVQIAASLEQMFESEPGRTRPGGGRGLRIVGDASTSTLIVRAEDEEFEQVAALAAALQQQASTRGLSVKVLPLKDAPAARVATAIREAFTAKARQTNAPLSISVDAAGNSLIVASTGPLFDEIAATVEQMDAMAPTAGQAIFIIELENVTPAAAESVIRTIGLDRPQPAESVSRVVSEPIKVTTLPGRNALAVVASPGDRETVVGLLKAIDAEPSMAETEVRVVRLRNAEATSLAELLRQVVSTSTQEVPTAFASAIREQLRRLSFRRTGLNEENLDLDLAVPIEIIADAGANALLIGSTPDNVTALEQIVAMLDTVPLTDSVAVQIFPLENIAAQQFARIVRELFQQGKRLGQVPGAEIAAVPAGTAGRALLAEIALSVDERTNTVVVAGQEDAVALVEVLVKRIDTEVPAGWVEPQIIPLRHADAETIAETLQEVLVEGASDLPDSSPLQKQVARLRVLRQGGDPADVIDADVFRPMTRTLIRADRQLNALVVVGTPANLEVVHELVGQLDVEAASPSAMVRIYPLEHASASKMAAVVGRLFDQQFQNKAIRDEDRVRIQADERTNALIVSTSTRSFAVLENLLLRLDAAVPLEMREIRTIPVANASASRLADLVQRLMDARLERLQKVQPETADLEKTMVVADPRSNSLVVAAGNESFEVVQRLVEQLDNAEDLEASLVQVIYLEKVNADRISRAVEALMERRYADLPADVRRSQRPMVLTDARSNSLLVAAGPEDLRTIEDLVSKLELAPVNPAIGLHVVPLTNGRADALAPRIESLMRERRESLGDAASPADSVSVEPDDGSNSLIVAASAENLEIIENLVDVLVSTGDGGGDGGGGVEILTLSKSRAADVLPLIEEMYVDEENRRRGEGTVRVTADDRLNAVLVSGTPSDVDAVRRIVERLDGSRPDSVVEIKYLSLTSANAVETVALIEDVLSGRSVSGRRAPQQATVLKYLQEIGDGTVSETEVNAAIRESINLTPDIRTNTIIVSAPRDSMLMIEQMVADLDASELGAQKIKVFKLKNADAEAMAEILFDLFNLRERDDLLVLKPREDAGLGGAPGLDGAAPAPGGLGGIELTAVPDERQQLSITVDSRTNSLLVSASPKYLDLVTQVVDELDAEEANERETRIFRLKNAVAEDVAQVIGEFVALDQQKLVETLGSDQLPSAARLLEREVTIVGDSLTNTVLITASPRYMNEVASLVEELDVDPPQVLIQVLLAEVTLEAEDALGVDAQGTFNIGDVAVSGGYGLASAFLGSVGIPPSATGIPNVSVVGNDFSLVINALSAQGRVQLLSNPSVMAANNQPAEIQVGQTIRVPDSVSIAAGQQQSAVTPEDIGIILKVTPTINPDGFVRMTINPEISELSSNTTQISENFESPIIDRRRADTTVTVKDGETIVIGGLIQDRYERIVNKIPFFGDIPLLGWLFRNEKEGTRKTELLIVLTPYVIVSPSQITAADRQAYTLDEIERLSMPDVLKDQLKKSRLRGTGLEFGSEADRNPPGFMDLEKYSERNLQVQDLEDEMKEDSGDGVDRP